MACFFVGSKPLSEPMQTSLMNPSEMYSNKFSFEIKIFAFTKTRLHNFNHFFKDLWVAIIGMVNILDVIGRK